ncbi:MAG: uroporphyrinogen-III synthase [Thiotrichales bacterium]|nr:MAG: uroporphyrinogen-III synthase [Thiotrichales bacterium]
MPSQQIHRPLQDLKVLVTRPVQRAAGLCRLIEQAGGIALPFAAIEITAPADTQRREYARDHLAEFSLAIFISPTAVEKTFEFFEELPVNIRITAIGSRTASALESRGLNIDIKPDGHDSESLLEHPELQAECIAGKSILIFKGEGGRELLGETLQSRGAEVVYADMYRRALPSSTEKLDQYLTEADVITVSSNEGLQNLFELASEKTQLVRHCLIVPGKRAYTLAKKLGFSKILTAENATDEAFLNALTVTITKMRKNP